ncbi:protein of unknown function [Streptomyces sp. KY75]|nr:protein of unknown function [Streptomyces sp. KY70]CAD5993271.1 protein of unknown function [Streptomyces sp. KY75]
MRPGSGGGGCGQQDQLVAVRVDARVRDVPGGHGEPEHQSGSQLQSPRGARVQPVPPGVVGPLRPPPRRGRAAAYAGPEGAPYGVQPQVVAPASGPSVGGPGEGRLRRELLAVVPAPVHARARRREHPPGDRVVGIPVPVVVRQSDAPDGLHRRARRGCGHQVAVPVDQEFAGLPVAQHHERRRPAEDRDTRLTGPPPYAYGDGSVRCVEVDGRQQPVPGLLVTPEAGGHREVPAARRDRQVFGGYGDRYPAPDQGPARIRAVRIEDQQLARPVVHAGDQFVRQGEEPGVLGEVPVVQCRPLVAVREVQQADAPGDLVGDQEAGWQMGRVGHGELLRAVYGSGGPAGSLGPLYWK